MSRLSVVGLDAQLVTTSFNNPMHGMYAVGAKDLHVRSPRDPVMAPWNYMRLAAPVNSAYHASFFHLVRSAQVIQGMEAWLCHPTTLIPEFRLQGRVVNGTSASFAPMSSSFLGPTNQHALESKGQYEWLQYSIPRSAVLQYKNSSNELNIAYNRLSISADVYAFCAGLAVVPNPYGVSFLSATDLSVGANGGAFTELGSWLHKGEAFAYLAPRARVTNLRLPICDCFDTYVMLVLFQDETTSMPPNASIELSGRRYSLDRFTVGRAGHKLTGLNIYRCVVGTRIDSLAMTPNIIQVGGRDYLQCTLVNHDPLEPLRIRGIITELVSS